MKNNNNLKNAILIFRLSVLIILITISFSSIAQSGPSISKDIEENKVYVKTDVQPNNNGSLSVRSLIWYNPDHTILKSIRYYDETSLPPYIASKVHKEFEGKKIYGVTEESSEKGIIYHIVLEDDTKWYHVSSDGSGYLTLESKFIKG